MYLLSLKQDQIPEPIVKKVEFRLLLYLACQEAPQNVIQVWPMINIINVGLHVYVLLLTVTTIIR